MRKILIYPVDREIISVINSFEYTDDMEIVALVSLKSWGCENEIYGDKHKVKINCEYEKSLELCSEVWIVDSWNSLDFEGHIMPEIQLALSMQKEIYCFRKMGADIKARLDGTGVHCMENTPKVQPGLSGDSKLKQINTPIVSILGTTDYCNKFYIQIGLKYILEKWGYRVLLLSSRKEAAMFGGIPIPEEILSLHLTESQKVVYLNHYLRRLEREMEPEIILMGFPGAVLNYNPLYSSDFGILALEMASAVSSDFSILSSAYHDYDRNYFSNIEKGVQGRLGMDIDLHTLAYMAVDFSAMQNIRKMSYLSVDKALVSLTIQKIRIDSLMDLNCRQGIECAAQRIVDKLSGEMDSMLL